MPGSAFREQERSRLTIREMHVLGQVAEGLTNKQIARRLGLSENTVRNHLSHVFEKLEARNRTAAVMAAMRDGLQIV
jgi:DNA-binding NarL/FixJ family response regulator